MENMTVFGLGKLPRGNIYAITVFLGDYIRVARISLEISLSKMWILDSLDLLTT